MGRGWGGEGMGRAGREGRKGRGGRGGRGGKGGRGGMGWEGREGPRENRDRPGVGVVGDTVYLVGGASTRTLLDIVEKWDGTNWTQCAPLNIARSEHLF